MSSLPHRSGERRGLPAAGGGGDPGARRDGLALLAWVLAAAAVLTLRRRSLRSG